MADADVNFKTGNICRIYIKDFLTLEEVEVRPKPNLNFICGPNGSGKSAILCAICLCLGAKGAITGRGNEIAQYVKHGQLSATIEVEVYMEGDEPNIIINRKFDTTGKSFWNLQGKDVSKKKVDAQIAALNIQMENLCQFLPQDRVANFAKMNARQLLEATEMAVGDPQLSKEHSLLITSGDRLATLHGRVDDLKNQLSLSVKRNAQLKDAISNHELKVKLEASIAKLKTQRLWFVYDSKRKLHTKQKEICDKLQADLKKKREEVNPGRKEVDKKMKLAQRLKDLQKEKSDAMKNRQESSEEATINYDEHTEHIRDSLLELSGKKNEEQQRERQLGDLNKQLSVLQAQLNNMQQLNEYEVAVKLQELTKNIQCASKTFTKLQGQQDEAMMRKRACEQKMRGCEKEMRSIQDTKSQRMNLLHKRNKDAYTAVQWLREHQEKFSAPVHFPMCTLINLSHPKFAKYVENRISFNDLVSFVCENKDDMNLFKQAMDRQGIRVNIVYSAATPLSNYMPSVPIEKLREYGFQTYMRECVDAPPAILSYLCRNYDIHRIPIAEQGDYTAVPPTFNNFYIGDRRYGKNKSRYDGEISTTIQHLREPELLHITVDNNRVENLKKEMQEGKEELEECGRKWKQAEAQMDDMRKQLESWRNDKRVLVSRKDERKVLEQRISQKKSQVQRCMAGSIDIKREEQITAEKIRGHIRDMVQATRDRGKGLAGWVSDIEKHLVAEVKARILDKSIKEQKQLLHNTAQELVVMEEEYEKAITDMDILKTEAQTALQKLLRGLGVSHYTQISEEVREQFQTSNLDDTEKKLAEEEAHRDCLVTATDREIEEYKKREAEMRQLQCRLDDAQAATDTHTQDLNEVKESWLPRITKLMEDISATFSQFMARLGCAGEVILSEPRDPNAFNLYGFSIRVSFRDHEKLRELTAQHQSGGERAMCTALYLLALQSLTPVPFRCVDEINQGMDPINERQMLNMLMETEMRKNASQYFFVTPKLLPGMQYGKCVNVIVVFNSPSMIPHSRFTLSRILETRRNQKKGRKQGREGRKE